MLKIVKRPRVRPPKVNKKPQQIVFKPPPQPIARAQAVTVHLKVEPTRKEERHEHVKCGRHGGSPSPRYGQGHKENEPGKHEQPLARRRQYSPGFYQEEQGRGGEHGRYQPFHR